MDGSVRRGDGVVVSGPGAGRARLAGAELCYELVGGGPDGADLRTVIVLVNGLAGQLIDWDEGLLDGLRAAGLATLRFDNRDAGLSSPGDERFRFNLQAVATGDRSAVAYTLDDMADDVAGLLDHLGIGAAHVLGVSMGGMIAQLVALRHPGRVRSLTSIMSTTGARDVGQPTPEATAVLTGAAPAERQAFIEWELANQRVLGSPGFPPDEERLRQRAEARYDRARRPEGVARQLMAILMAADRTGDLGRVTVPTLVVHGEDDALVTVSGGRATAAAVPGAELLVVPGMGHELPPAVVPDVVAAVARTVARVGATGVPAGEGGTGR